MQPVEIVKLSFDALRQRKVRSILTILMVVVGAALIVALTALSAGFSVVIDKQFSLLSPNTMIVTPLELMGRGLRPVMELDGRVVKNIEKIPGVESVVPIIQQPVILKVGTTTKSVSLMGIDNEKTHLLVSTFELEEGTLVYPYDTTGILLGNEVKYPPGSTSPIASLGQSVTIEYNRLVNEGGSQKTVTERRSFIVRGSVVNLGAGFILPLDRSISVSLKAADQLFQKGGKYDLILVVTKSSIYNTQVEEGVRKIYGKNIGVTSAKVLSQTIQSLTAGFSIFVLGIAAVSLLVAAVGIITTLMTSVMERTKEIGLLKALGFNNRHILLLFLFEATIIGLIGASTGLAGGFLLGHAMPAVIGLVSDMESSEMSVPAFEPVFLPMDLVGVWVFALVLSAVAGFYPSWRASKLDPVDALRKEL